MIQEDKNFLLFSTTGSSMFPFIRWNEQILIKKIPPEKMKISDVILFQSKNGIKICHRIVNIENRDGLLWFKTKGDRNRFYDPVFNNQAVLGKVIAVKHRKHFLEFNAKNWDYLFSKLKNFFVLFVFLTRKLLRKAFLFLQKRRLYKLIFRPILSRNINFVNKILDKDKNYKFSITKNDKIIAWVHLVYSEDKPYPGWWVWSLEVKPIFRGIGLSKQLMKNLIEFAKQEDSPSLYVNVSNENLASLKLFKDLGFIIVPGSERACSIQERKDVYLKKNL